MRRKKFGGQEIQHDGATERIVYARKLWGKKRNDDYTEYRSSFALNNGEYAYQDWDEDNQREFFRVVKIRDPNVFKLLDEADHDEEKDDRHAEEASDYAQLRYEAMAEAQEEEALASPPGEGGVSDVALSCECGTAKALSDGSCPCNHPVPGGAAASCGAGDL